MYSIIYLNNEEIDAIEGMSIAEVFTALMLGKKVVVTIRDNTNSGTGTVGLMCQNRVFEEYQGMFFMSFLKSIV